MCALEKELSLEARMKAAGVNDGDIDRIREGAQLTSVDCGETLTVEVYQVVADSNSNNELTLVLLSR